MILYMDTSNLVKLYVLEKDSAQIKASVEDSQIVATSIIAYAEARAAFARKFRAKAIKESVYMKIVLTLDNDWENYFVLNVSQDIIKLAGSLCEKYWLRGFDALHLASASIINESVTGKVHFCCSDSKLNEAARKEKLGTVPNLYQK